MARSSIAAAAPPITASISMPATAIGSRPTVLGALEKYVEEQYGKTMYFKARMRNAGERLNTIYVSDEELKNAVHMDITIEDE